MNFKPIISGHITSLIGLVSLFSGTANELTGDVNIDASIIKTLYVVLDAIKAQTIIIQQDLDTY